jgi:plasmid maintenance system killer protein
MTVEGSALRAVVGGSLWILLSTPPNASTRSARSRASGCIHSRGDRRGQWAITVNGPWRICFRFKDGNADEVEIVDYH